MIFRYPGAKNKHLSMLDSYLHPFLDGAKEFHDVYAGGGALLLHVARKYPRLALQANDLDGDVADFWRVVISDQVDELCERLRVRPTIENFYEVRAQKPTNRVGRAFRVLFLNRTCFSGLIHGYPIGGATQSSQWKVFSHYDGKQLAREVLEAHRLLKGRTCVTSVDGAKYVSTHRTAVKYLDPPYFVRGDYSYRQRMTLADHLCLTDELKKATNWVLSYDHCPAITQLYSWAKCHPHSSLYRINQRKEKCVTGQELVILPR